MKKAILILAFALLLVCMSPAAFAAAEIYPYDIHLSIMYNYLTDNQRVLYDRMYDAIRHGQSSVPAPKGMIREELEWMTDYIYNEAPELCAYDRWGTRVVESSAGTFEIHISYKRPISEQDAFIEEMEELGAYFKGMEDEPGLLAIHDYLCSRFDYGSEDDLDTQLAYDAMVCGKAVCNGYAQSMAMLCHFAGYPCSYIDGHVLDDRGNSIGNHAWNVAIIGTRFVWLDATWDDAGSNAVRTWFWLDGPTMAKSHRPDPEYAPIKDLQDFLPEEAVVGMYLDINDGNGYVRGVLSESGKRVRLQDLGPGQYYTPALAIYNYGSRPLNVQVSYRFNGRESGWKETTINGESNLAYRTFMKSLAGARGYHEITWYCDGNFLGTFTWTVD